MPIASDAVGHRGGYLVELNPGFGDLGRREAQRDLAGAGRYVGTVLVPRPGTEGVDPQRSAPGDRESV